jgi:hypothetical protein
MAQAQRENRFLVMCIETLPLKRFGIVRWRRALIAFAGILPERVKIFGVVAFTCAENLKRFVVLVI